MFLPLINNTILINKCPESLLAKIDDFHYNASVLKGSLFCCLNNNYE